jgi:hypothetical protein
MPVATTAQRESAICRFRVVALLRFSRVVVGMVVRMRFLDMLFIFMMMRIRVSMRMGVSLWVMRIGRRKRRRRQVRMDMKMVATWVVVVERPDLWEPEGQQEDSCQDDSTSSRSALPWSPDCHVVLIRSSSLLPPLPCETARVFGCERIACFCDLYYALP